MPAIVILALFAALILAIIVVVSVVGFVLHVLFSPVLVIAGLAALAWLWLRPSRRVRH